MKFRKLILMAISAFFEFNPILCSNNINYSRLKNNEAEKSQNSSSFSSSQSEASIYLNIKNSAYTNEVIEIDGNANKQYKINTSSKNIDIVEAKIEYTSDVILKFKINSYENVVFDFINSNNEIVDSKTLYLLDTDLGTFISQVSNQINIDNYKAQQLNENKISLVEYDEYNASSNLHSAIETPTGKLPSFHKPLQIATLYGYLKWTNNKGITYPLKNVYVELIGKKTLFQMDTIAKCYTDENGYYLFPIDVTKPDDLYLDILNLKPVEYFVRIYAKTEHSEILKNIDNNTKYYYDTKVYSRNELSDSLNIENSYTFLNDGNESDSYISKAMEISQALYYGEKYAYEMQGSHPGFEKVEYPGSKVDINAGKHYSNSHIALGEYTYAYWDLVLHEYGHHLQEWLGIMNDDGGVHNFYTDCLMKYDKDKAMRLSWAEAWPTVYANLVTKYYGDELVGIQYINDDCYNAPDKNNGLWEYSLESNIYEGKTYALGETCEENIMQVLFDLYDGKNESFDCIELGHKGLWELMANSKATTFNSFTQYVYNYSILNVNDYNKILSEYGMSATELSIVEMDNKNTKLLIIWKKNNINQLRSDSLIFTNENDEVILKIENIEDKSMRNEEYTSYKLSFDEWEIIKSSNGSKFRITIYSTFKKTPETGPYYSIQYEFRKSSFN